MTDKIDAGMSFSRRNLQAVTGEGGESEEDIELLGRLMIYTVGEVYVPREWLLEKCEELGVPERLIPSEVTPHSAYKRAMGELFDDPARRVRYDVQDPAERVEFDLLDGDGNINHIRANVFFPEHAIGEEGGRWDTHELGTFGYDADSQRLVATPADDTPEALEGSWERIVGQARDLMELMQDRHNETDIRHMAYYLRLRYTDSIVPMRDGGAVYFVPEGELADIVDSLQELYREIDRKFKSGGSMAIRQVEVLDGEDKREWVRSRVEQSLDRMVEKALDEAFGKLDEDDTAEEIVAEALDRIQDAEDTADRYNDLLEAQLAVEELLKERVEELTDEKGDLAQKIVKQSSLEDFGAAEAGA